MRRALSIIAGSALALSFVAVLALPADAGGPNAFADVKYRLAGGVYQGGGPEYPSCGGGPIAKIKRGKTAVFELKVKNTSQNNTVDVNIGTDEFTSNANFNTKFLYGTADVTGDASDGTFQIEDLQGKKSSKVFKVRAKATQSAATGFHFFAPFVDSAFFGSPDDCASLNIKVKP